MSLTSFFTSLLFRRGDNKRDAGLTTPADIQRFDDLAYGPDHRWNVLDVYRPRAVRGALPVIISIHGGGWVYGDKERYQHYCMSLAQQGFAVVNFTYRLAPAHKYPASMVDTDLVFHWVHAQAETYGFDLSRVFAVGDSAGAHMLGLYCCLCTDPAFAAATGVCPPPSLVPRAVALNCGVYRIRASGRRDLTARLMADLLPGKGTAEELALISVLDHVNAAFPPALVMTCQGDFLADQAPPLVERLRELGVPVEYRFYGDAEHVLGHVFHCNMKLEEAHRCNRDECDYFHSFP